MYRNKYPVVIMKHLHYRDHIMEWLDFCGCASLSPFNTEQQIQSSYARRILRVMEPASKLVRMDTVNLSNYLSKIISCHPKGIIVLTVNVDPVTRV